MNATHLELKEALETVDTITPERVQELMPVLLENIGSTDSELRDDLIYGLFCKLIVEEKCVDEGALKTLFHTLLSEDYMFYNIGNTHDDSVFKRSFSVLTLTLVVSRLIDMEGLSLDDMRDLMAQTKRYLSLESDSRGYVSEKGWAHSIAHCADLIEQISCFDQLTESDYTVLLEMVQDKLLTHPTPLSASEDERLSAFVTFGIVKEELVDLKILLSWVETFSVANDIEDAILRNTVRYNCRNFIRSLYMGLIHLGHHSQLMNALVEVEKSLNLFSKVYS